MTYMSGIRAVGFVLFGLGAAPVIAQTVSAEAEAVFELAEELYPDLFLSGSELREAGGYTYRFYQHSGVYVGIRDGAISLRGGPFGNNISNRGAISDLRLVLESRKAAVAVTPTADMLALFDLAAQLQPALFGQPGELRTSADGYLYRYYPGSGIYAAIRNGSVYLKGGVFGNVYSNRGALNSIVASLRARAQGNPGPNIPGGDFTLTVSGTVSVSGISSAVNVVLEDMAAPDTSDLESIEQAFEDSVAAVPGLVISNTSFVVINNTANHIEFTMNVTASITQGGVTIPYVYDLRYNYVR